MARFNEQLPIYMYMCVCVYIYVCVCVCIYIYICVCVYIYILSYNYTLASCVLQLHTSIPRMPNHIPASSVCTTCINAPWRAGDRYIACRASLTMLKFTRAPSACSRQPPARTPPRLTTWTRRARSSAPAPIYMHIIIYTHILYTYIIYIYIYIIYIYYTHIMYVCIYILYTNYTHTHTHTHTHPHPPPHTHRP